MPKKIIILLFCIIAVLSRFGNLDKKMLDFSESRNGYRTFEVSKDFLSSEIIYEKGLYGPLLTIVSSIYMKIFGGEEFSLRILIIFFGLLIFLLIFLLKAEYDFSFLITLATLFLISPSITYFTRSFKPDLLVISFFSLILFFILKYLKNPRNSYIFYSVILAALMITTKADSYFILFIFSSFFLYNYFFERGKFKENFHKSNNSTLLLIALFFLLFSVGQFTVNFLIHSISPGNSSSLYTAFWLIYGIFSILFLFFCFKKSQKLSGEQNQSAKTAMVSIITFVSLLFIIFSHFFTHRLGLRNGLINLPSDFFFYSGELSGPWYYYLRQIVPFEFLPVSLFFIAINYYFLAKPDLLNFEKKLLIYWGISALVFYSLLGEKAPWNVLYIIFPMIVFSAFFISDLLKNCSRKKLLIFLLLAAYPIGLTIFFNFYFNNYKPSHYKNSLALHQLSQISQKQLKEVKSIVSQNFRDDKSPITFIGELFPFKWYLRNDPVIFINTIDAETSTKYVCMADFHKYNLSDEFQKGYKDIGSLNYTSETDGRRDYSDSADFIFFSSYYKSIYRKISLEKITCFKAESENQNPVKIFKEEM